VDLFKQDPTGKKRSNSLQTTKGGSLQGGEKQRGIDAEGKVWKGNYKDSVQCVREGQRQGGEERGKTQNRSSLLLEKGLQELEKCRSIQKNNKASNRRKLCVKFEGGGKEIGDGHHPGR